MTRVIVHAGFHKTGTTGLQEFLARNRTILQPYFDLFLNQDFPEVGATSRIYAQRPFPWRKRMFRRAFRRFLSTVPAADAIILSRETFAGVMPGHRNIFGRLIVDQSNTAIRLARVIVTELRRRFGPDTEIQFLYTTRTQGPWLRSVYGHLLRSIHLRDDFETFRAGFNTPPDPERDARTIATALAPVPVYIARLEDFADHPEGTAAALLDLLDIPEITRQQLRPAPHANRGQSPELEQEFLRLNRSGQRKSTLKATKDHLLSQGSTE